MAWFLANSEVFGLHIQHWVPVFATIFAVWTLFALLNDHSSRERH
jgi:hypothetical protein